MKNEEWNSAAAETVRRYLLCGSFFSFLSKRIAVGFFHFLFEAFLGGGMGAVHLSWLCRNAKKQAQRQFFSLRLKQGQRKSGDRCKESKETQRFLMQQPPTEIRSAIRCGKQPILR